MASILINIQLEGSHETTLCNSVLKLTKTNLFKKKNAYYKIILLNNILTSKL